MAFIIVEGATISQAWEYLQTGEWSRDDFVVWAEDARQEAYNNGQVSVQKGGRVDDIYLDIGCLPVVNKR